MLETVNETEGNLIALSGKQNQIFFPESSYPKYNIVTKGRRSGLTRGAAGAFCFMAICEDDEEVMRWFPKGDLLFLWGDTINGNIDRYVERYFLPILKQFGDGIYKWDSQKRMLKINRLTIDFRSADRPENWEGFGYHLIFLNEAGIILADDYLYNNAVLPMLIDFEGCKLIAGGVPKGKLNKGEEHKFYTLFKAAAIKKDVNYRHIHMSPYDNPFIARSEIQLLIDSMDSETKRQEVDGEFIDTTSKPFLYAFSETLHTIPSYEVNRALPILISFDFNKDPMTCVVSQMPTYNTLRIFDAIKLPNSSTPEMCEYLMEKYGHWVYFMDVTGDATGHSRSPLLKGNVNHWLMIKQLLKLKDYNLKVKKINMGHRNSRIHCNAVLQKLDIKVVERLTPLISDCVYGSVDETGELVKTAVNGLHFLDNFRYTLHTAFEGFTEHPEKYGAEFSTSDQPAS